MQKNRKGLSKIAYIIIAVVVISAFVLVFFGNSDPCGNGTCRTDKGENCNICPSDCGPCSSAEVCGDGLCTGEEDNVKCSVDCKPPGACGDGACGFNENCADCPSDCACGSGQYCSPTFKTCSQRPCGDGKCDSGLGEDCDNCPSDCGECQTTHECGDVICDSDETFLVCPSDCRDVCGNGVCGPAENCWDCPRDCKCGVGEYCSPEERRCVAPVCGNQKCEIFENSAICCIDCPCEISYAKCNTDTKTCESPSMVLGDEDIKKIVAAYYGKKSMQAEIITPLDVYVWGGKVGRKTGVKLAGQVALKYVLVTDTKEVIELPFF